MYTNYLRLEIHIVKSTISMELGPMLTLYGTLKVKMEGHLPNQLIWQYQTMVLHSYMNTNSFKLWMQLLSGIWEMNGSKISMINKTFRAVILLLSLGSL